LIPSSSTPEFSSGVSALSAGSPEFISSSIS